ncbi:MAG: xylulokinase [Pseudomonadales bacterium]|nr:xylulokinase [Pseudomonadales bacterium]
MSQTVVGLDLGTQGVKLLAYDFMQKKLLASASAPLELISRPDGTREQLAEWWIDAVRHCFSAIPQSVKDGVVAIGVSGQQHGFVPLDKNGKVLAPVKLWCDTATEKACRDIIEAAGGDDACFALTGLHPKTGYTLSKIRWLRDHQPEVYAQLSTILLPHDYLNYFFTGNYCMECGDASGTGLLDVRQRRWSHALINIVDADRDLATCLPPLIEPFQQAGKIRPALAAELGLPESVVLSAGGGDNMMAAIGTGNVVPGELTASLGTSGTLFAFSNEPLNDEQGDLAAFCSSTGGWLPLLCTMNCTIATEQIRKLLKLQQASMDALAAKVAPGADGVVTLPFYNGERTPNLPNAKAVVFGLDHNNTSESHLLRSAMESAIFGLKNGVAAFSRCGLGFREVTLTGGGSNSAVWRQMCADILELPVRVLKQNENAAFGAALQALWCYSHEQQQALPLQAIVEQHLAYDESGFCEPDRDAIQVYQGTYQRYADLIEAVKPLYMTMR